jgi:6-hydroxy-3-succinoylpyridine 3-monooxygenase
MRPGTESALRTRIYIDGYNLYYGCLKNTAHKWLDLRALIERILPSVLHEQNGAPISSEFCTPSVKYFTAPILKSFARSEDSVACQSQYHSALRGHLGEELELITGYYDARPARAHAWVESKAARELIRENRRDSPGLSGFAHSASLCARRRAPK